MVHVGNHRHVTDVFLIVHDLTDLVYREIHLETERNNDINQITVLFKLPLLALLKQPPDFSDVARPHLQSRVSSSLTK